MKKATHIEVLSQKLNREIDLSKFHQQAESLTRELILEYFKELPEIIYKESNKRQKQLKLLNTWWLTAFSEKSTIRTKLVSDIYFIQNILLFSRKNEPFRKKNVNAYLKTSFVQYKFRYLKLAISLIYTIIQSLYLSMTTLIAKQFLQTQKIHSKKHVLFTLFPYWWNIKPNDYQERFFPNINKIKADNFGVLFWNNFKLRDFFKIIEYKKFSNSIKNAIFLGNYFNIIRMFKIINFRLIFHLFKLARIILTKKIYIGEIEVSKIFYKYFLISLKQFEFVQNQLIVESLDLYTKHHKPTSIFSRFENQPLDRAIKLGTQGKLPLIGYWHSVLCKCENYISLNFSGELSSSRKYKNNFENTLPDKFIVSNQLNFDVLVKYGVLRNNIYKIGNIRYENLHSSSNGVSNINFLNKFDLPKNFMLITIASSIVDEIDFRLDKLVENLIEINSNIYVFRRYHPSKKIRTSKLANARIITSTKDLNVFDFLSKSRFTITTGSQLAFEALYLGSEPLIFEPKGIFNSTEFQYFYKYFGIFEQEGALLNHIRQNINVNKFNLNKIQMQFLKELNLSKNIHEFHHEYSKLF